MALSPGDTAPTFTAPLAGGGQVSLDDHLHQVVVLAFNGLTWCAPCQFEAPVLENLWQAYKPGVQFLMVSYNDEQGALQSAIQSFGITMPVLLDADGSIAEQYIATKLASGGTSYAVPMVFVLTPPSAGGVPIPGDHLVVCSSKLGAGPPEAALEADLAARIDACLPSPPRPWIWEEYNPIKWLDPGPLRRLSPDKRDILVSMHLGETARHLGDAAAAREVELQAAERMLEAARATLARARAKPDVDLHGQTVVTRTSR